MIFVPDRMMRTICIRVHSGTMSYTTCWQRSRWYVYVIVVGLLMKIEKTKNELAQSCTCWRMPEKTVTMAHWQYLDNALYIVCKTKFDTICEIQHFDQWEISRILNWRYASTIFQAIFWGGIPLHRPYIGLFMVGTSNLGSFNGHWQLFIASGSIFGSLRPEHFEAGMVPMTQVGGVFQPNGPRNGSV